MSHTSDQASDRPHCPEPQSKFPVLVLQNETAGKLLALPKSCVCNSFPVPCCILTSICSSFLLSLREMAQPQLLRRHTPPKSVPCAWKAENVFAAETVNRLCSTQVKTEYTTDIEQNPLVFLHMFIIKMKQSNTATGNTKCIILTIQSMEYNGS